MFFTRGSYMNGKPSLTQQYRDAFDRAVSGDYVVVGTPDTRSSVAVNIYTDVAVYSKVKGKGASGVRISLRFDNAAVSEEDVSLLRESLEGLPAHVTQISESKVVVSGANEYGIEQVADACAQIFHRAVKSPQISKPLLSSSPDQTLVTLACAMAGVGSVAPAPAQHQHQHP